MSTLNIRALEVTGSGRSTKVVITLCDYRGIPVIGYTSDGTVVHKISTRTDHNGELSVELVPNIGISPSNTYYLVQLDDHVSIIEKGSSEESVIDCIASDLNPLQSVLGVSNLEDLLNVQLDSLSDGDILTYEASTGLWVNVSRSSLGL